MSVARERRQSSQGRFAGFLARILLCLTVLMLVKVQSAKAEDVAEFFQPGDPPHLGLTLFGMGFGSPLYGTTHQGFELSQTLTKRIGLLARLSGYELYQGSGFDNPLGPHPKRSAPFFFGRYEGGIDITPWDGGDLTVTGGKDFGDSNSNVIGGSVSSWFLTRSKHPISFSIESSHYFANDVSNGVIDLRTVAMSTGQLLLFAGAGSIIWGGGTAKGPKVDMGPDLGVFLRSSRVRIDLQAGYGSSHAYGFVTFSRHFNWDE